MIEPPLPELQSALDELVPQVANSPHGIWHVVGQPSAGKSALVHALEEKLAPKLVPLRVSPPAAQLDSGGIALVELGAALHRRGLINGQLEAFVAKRQAWPKKLAEVREWLAPLSEQIVVLCDEPGSWPALSGDVAPLGEHARDVANMLFSLPCRRVVAGRVEQALPDAKVVRLTPRTDARGWLNDASTWGDLADDARRLFERSGAHLGHRSPLDVRLLVAHETLGGHVDPFATRRQVAQELSVRLATSHPGRAAAKVWARLALLRMPFDDSALAVAGLDALEPKFQKIIRACLLFRQAGQLVMHDMLRVDVREHLRADERQHAHRTFADHYTELFQTPAQTGQKLRFEMEAYYHATEAGDVGDRRAFFSDQLDALGRAMSSVAIGRPRNPRPDRTKISGAVNAFHEALRWDDEDDYAHHYIAYNRDVIADDPVETEKHFKRAILLAPSRVWWRSRYITFLLALSRLKDARRAWDDACDAIGLPDPEASPALYEELHLWVGRLLIHRGQTEFAETVLEAVPHAVLEDNAALRAMHRRLRALIEARERGAFVPGPLLTPDWWKQGPFLLPAKLRQGQSRIEWMAARVDSIQDGQLHLRVARVARSAVPETGTLSISFGEFAKICPDAKAADLAAGRFLEIGKYKLGTKVVTHVRVHRDGAWDARDLPPLFPDPTRYVRP